MTPVKKALYRPTILDGAVYELSLMSVSRNGILFYGRIVPDSELKEEFKIAESLYRALHMGTPHDECKEFLEKLGYEVVAKQHREGHNYG